MLWNPHPEVARCWKVRVSLFLFSKWSRFDSPSCRVYLIRLSIILFLCGLPPGSCAQPVSLDSVAVESLPDAPATEHSASISGTIFDANGGMLSNASVTLTLPDGSAERTLVSGSRGEFVFRGLSPGQFNLKITSPGMEPLVVPDIVVRANQDRELPRIVLAIAGTTTEVRVNVTQIELAQEQVKAAEHQRVLGVLPNFYSSYIWDAEPLNANQKFNLAFHSIVDPVEFVGTAIIAGAEQANGTFAGYGQGTAGYAKRYGAAYADDVIGRMIGSAILPSLLHQDPRYFYKGSGSVRSRAYYAVTRALITRGDNGQAQPNYSRLLGSFAAGGIANLYYPRSDRGVALTLGDGLVSIAGHAADNLIREFFLRRLTPKYVPVFERGKNSTSISLFPSVMAYTCK